MPLLLKFKVFQLGYIATPLLLSLAVAVAIKAVGVLLVNAFLVIPASIAKLISYHFAHFLIMAVILGAISSLAGMIVSGSSIVLVQFLLFLALFAWSKLATT